jgi:hypothetical protein
MSPAKEKLERDDERKCGADSGDLRLGRADSAIHLIEHSNLLVIIQEYLIFDKEPVVVYSLHDLIVNHKVDLLNESPAYLIRVRGPRGQSRKTTLKKHICEKISTILWLDFNHARP